MKRFDAYGKVPDDYKVKHNFGGILTIICFVIMVILGFFEFKFYIQREQIPNLHVDQDRQGKIPIHFDITFPYSSCPIMSIDILTKSGDNMIDVEKNVTKIRLHKSGREMTEDEKQTILTKIGQPKHKKECPSCHGAESPKRKCCYTCDDVIEAYREKGWKLDTKGIEQCKDDEKIQLAHLTQDEGCRIIGDFELNKIGGNFHITPGSSEHGWYGHVHNYEWTGRNEMDMTHTWNNLTFGEKGKIYTTTKKDEKKNTMFQYFVTVIPMKENFINGTSNKFDFAVNENIRTGYKEGEPGVFIYYDVSPMIIEVKEFNHGFLHFLIGICSIVGGIFTFFQLLDAFVFESIHTIKKKMELGKDL